MVQSSESENLDFEIVRGAAWVAMLRVCVRVLSLISTLILARLLMPEDFGLIALASVIAGSIEMFGSFNFDIWLVRHRQPMRDDYDTVWTMALIRDLIIATLLLALTQPAAAWFGDPDLEQVLRVLAAVTVVRAFRNIGVVDFRRDMRFDMEFKLLGLAKLCTFLVTMGLAFILRNYWALLGGIVAGAVCKVLLSYWLHPYRPRPSLRLAGEVFNFSRWLLVLTASSFTYRKVQDLVIGKSLGLEALGFFSIAQQFSDLATTEVLTPLRRVLLPAYSRMQEDLPKLRVSFSETFSLIILLGVPLTVGIALLAEPIVSVLLGERWLPTVPIMQIMAFYAMANVFLANQGPVLMALGRARLLSNIYGFGLLLKIPLLIWIARNGDLMEMAAVITVIHLILFAISIRFTLRAIKLSAGNLFLDCWHTLAASALMATVVNFVQSELASSAIANWLILVLCVAAGALVYTAAILALWCIDRSHAGGQNIVLRFVAERRSIVASRNE